MLDPRRIGLNAESVGFQKRMHQDIDFKEFDRALQTDYNNQNSAVEVRRLRDTPINEIHVMGGERNGFESNELLLTRARQERQINGYPLRQFDAKNPAVILPKKYGGFPMYNRNQTEYPELVSVFTEPMSAILQSGTELLQTARSGAIPITPSSLHTPYEAGYFVDPMSSSYDQLTANVNEMKQRKHLQNMSRTAMKGKGDGGIFISKNGQPMTDVQDALNSTTATNNAFALGVQANNARANYLMSRPLIGANYDAKYSVATTADSDDDTMYTDLYSSVSGDLSSVSDISYNTMGSHSKKMVNMLANVRAIAGGAGDLHQNEGDATAYFNYGTPQSTKSAGRLTLSHQSDDKAMSLAEGDAQDIVNISPEKGSGAVAAQIAPTYWASPSGRNVAGRKMRKKVALTKTPVVQFNAILSNNGLSASGGFNAVPSLGSGGLQPRGLLPPKRQFVGKEKGVLPAKHQWDVNIMKPMFEGKENIKTGKTIIKALGKNVKRHPGIRVGLSMR